MRFRFLILLTFALVLAGCAAAPPTPYQPSATGSSYGYGDRQVEPGRFRVWFTANGATPPATLENYLLYRAAEVTLAEGGDWFTVTERSLSPDYAGGGTTVGIGGGGGSRSGIGVGIGIGLPLGGDDGLQIASAEITVHRGPKPGGRPDAYDARAVRQSLRPNG